MWRKKKLYVLYFLKVPLQFQCPHCHCVKALDLSTWSLLLLEEPLSRLPSQQLSRFVRRVSPSYRDFQALECRKWRDSNFSTLKLLNLSYPYPKYFHCCSPVPAVLPSYIEQALPLLYPELQVLRQPGLWPSAARPATRIFSLCNYSLRQRRPGRLRWSWRSDLRWGPGSPSPPWTATSPWPAGRTQWAWPHQMSSVTWISAPIRLKRRGWNIIHIWAKLSDTGLLSVQPWFLQPGQQDSDKENNSGYLDHLPTPAVKAITRIARAPAPIPGSTLNLLIDSILMLINSLLIINN